MSSIVTKQAVRFYSQWSHEKSQKVYYHTNGVEYIAFVAKGAWHTGHRRKGSAVVAAMIGSPKSYSTPYTPINRRVMVDAVRKLKELEK